MPEVYEALVRTGKALEDTSATCRNIEFTIDTGKLFLLQTRTGKRTGFAAQIQPDQLSQLLSPVFDAKAKKAAAAKKAAKGFNAGPGAATGVIALTTEKAHELVAAQEGRPRDGGRQGILTARGGCTSHAAVVARGMGKPCVVGCSTLSIDEARGVVTASDTGLEAREGDPIAVDGFTGEVSSATSRHPSEIVQVLINKTLKPRSLCSTRTTR
eukprot:tig00020555_g10960.t1